jgi:tRNA threonylcarbamoyladenosine biosynthesis protein TsaB
MQTLAIDCATQTIGLALLDEQTIRAEFSLALGRHHAEVLMPALDQLCRIAGIVPGQIDLLACTLGPGSFTGLRMGVSTVKGLGLAWQRPIVGVSTLEALAMNVVGGRRLVCALLDSRKNQVYGGLYRGGPEGLPEPVVPERAGELERLLRELPAEGEIVFVGDGALRHRSLLEQALEGRAVLPGPSCHRIMAAAVGLIGRYRYDRGMKEDLLTLAPRYLRLCEAEMRHESG